MNRIENALQYLLWLMAQEGAEFPDACGRAASKHAVSYDALREAYDEHCCNWRRVTARERRDS